LGFATVLAIMGGLGLASYFLFQRIGRELDELADFRLEAARSATAVERQALEAMSQQKEFLSSRAPQSLAAARQSLQSVATELDKIAELAAGNADEEIANEAAQARQVATDCDGWVERGAAAVQRNGRQEALMEAKGNAGVQEVAALAERKKSEYVDARDSLAIANNINAAMLEMRFREKSYMLDRDPQHLAAIERNVTTIRTACDELDKRRPSDTEKKQIDLGRTQAAEYLKAAQAWAAEQKRDDKSAALADFSKGMSRAGDALSQMVDDYTICKQGAVENLAEAQMVAQEIVQRTLRTRLREKEYIVHRDRKAWEAVLGELAALKPLYEQLGKLTASPEDKKQTERAALANADYQAASTAWYQDDAQLHESILPKIRGAGERLIASGRAFQQAKGCSR
jgi:hypothetical protein